MGANSGPTILLDTLAGPIAHSDIVLAALRAQRDHVATIRLVGDAPVLEDIVKQHGAQLSDIECVHAPYAIGRRENASRALKLKDKTSLCTAMRLTSPSNAAMVSFGNATALRRLTHNHYAPPERICPFATIVRTDAGPSVLLDVGPFVETSARHLTEFGLMGALYFCRLHQIETASIALLSAETVSANCSERFRESHRLLNRCATEYRGLVSGRDWIHQPTSVAVCSSELGGIISELFHSQMFTSKRDDSGTGGFSWFGLLGRDNKRFEGASAKVEPCHLILGAERLFVHQRNVASPMDVYESIKEAASAAHLNLVQQVNELLADLDTDSMRTTLESQVQTGS